MNENRLAAKMFCALTLILVGIWGWYQYHFPFGHRDGTFRCTDAALRLYAQDHAGRFPNESADGLRSLRLLYPEYTPSGKELAGLSGDVGSLVQALSEGKQLNTNLSSWLYFPGLEVDDDSSLALLAETKFGLFPNGSRNPSGARSVLLLGRNFTNVTKDLWDSFAAEQQRLRVAAVAKRQLKQPAK